MPIARRCSALLFPMLVLLVGAHGAAVARAQSSTEAALSEIARIAPGQSPAELSERALALVDAFAEQRTELDQTLDRWLGTALAPETALLVVTARMQGVEPSAARLCAALSPLLQLPANDQAALSLSIAAAKLCGAPLFKSGLDKLGRAEFLKTLLGIAADAERAAELRLAAAASAHAIGGGEERRAARAVMLAFLESGDPARRGAAALCLAEAGDEIRGALAVELERLAKLPLPEGALAASHLEREELRRLHERKFKELERSLSTESAPPEVSELLAVLQLVEDAHLEGDKWTREQLMNAALDGLLGALDEHSTFMESEIFERFQQDLEAEYGGIGAYVGIDNDDGLFTITRPIYSGPAYKAGLASEDKIVRIDDWPTLREESETIIKRLKGKPGTRVKLYVWRRGMDPDLITRPTEDMAIEVTRAQIAIPAVASELLPGGIGLVQLNEFSRIAYTELRRELKNLVGSGARGIVFDLRGNPGGLLDEAVEVASLFLPKGSLVATTDSRVQPAERHVTTQDPVVPATVPLCVLVNQYSASASEIVSGALQDHRWATIVGERSYGKGSVQQLLPVAGMDDEPFADENDNRRFDLGEPYKDENKNGEYDIAPRVKLTIARWLLPSGRSIHRELNREGELVDEGGVKPDVEQPFSTTDLWRLEQRFQLRMSRRPRNYVDERWEANTDLFRELALCDDRDWTRYPGFEEFYASLATQLPRDDVRALLREELRRRTQDERGKEFPQGDFEEDLQLQRAIVVLFEKLGLSVSEFEDYQRTFRTSTSEVPLVAAAAETRGEVDRIQALVARLQNGDDLSSEELRQVQEFLASLEGGSPQPNLPKSREN